VGTTILGTSLGTQLTGYHPDLLGLVAANRHEMGELAIIRLPFTQENAGSNPAGGTRIACKPPHFVVA